MLELAPFLYTNLALGVTFFIVLLASAIILPIPVFVRSEGNLNGKEAGSGRRAKNGGNGLCPGG